MREPTRPIDVSSRIRMSNMIDETKQTYIAFRPSLKPQVENSLSALLVCHDLRGNVTSLVAKNSLRKPSHNLLVREVGFLLFAFVQYKGKPANPELRWQVQNVNLRGR
jgi:hypothetical protein